MKENFTFEEVVDLIETHLANGDCPWDDWFNDHYCNDCPSIVKKEEHFGRETDVHYGYCELHDECRYFGHMVDERELIEHWLKHLTMPPIPYLCEVDYGDNFEMQKDALMNEYGITANHAGCYLVNFFDEYICKAYNGGCPQLGVCGKIEESERADDE
jgi:hypothetical protein